MLRAEQGPPGKDDGNYDIKFHDQLLGEKNGMPIEAGLSQSPQRAAGGKGRSC